MADNKMLGLDEITLDEDEKKRPLLRLDEIVIDDTPRSRVREAPFYQPGIDFLEGLNRGIAGYIQAPFDVGRATNQMIFGGDVASWLPNYDPDHPTEGADAINDLLNYSYGLGYQVPFLTEAHPGDPDTIAGYMGKEVVHNLASMAPIGMAAKASKFNYGWFEPLVQFVRDRPLAAVLWDLGLAIPMGWGAYTGRQVGGETGEQLGRIAGSSLVAAPYLLGRGSALLFNKVKQLKGLGLTEESQTDLAVDALKKGMTEDQLAALKEGGYEMPSVGGPFTTGEVLDSGSLTALRNQIVRQTQQGQEADKMLQLEREDALIAELRKLSVDNTQPEAIRFHARRMEATIARINAHTEKSLAAAQVRIDRLKPDTAPEVSARIARDELEKAYAEARTAEGVEWGKIGEGRFLTDAIVQRAKEIVQDTARLTGPGGKPNVPLVVREVAGSEDKDSIVKSVEPIKEIIGLSSRINTAIRQANEAGEVNSARMLKLLRDSLYDDIVPIGKVNETALENARAFSRVLNDKFTRGSIGSVLGYKSGGSLAVNPELTLAKLVTPGPAGKVALQELRRTVEGTDGAERMDEMVQQHLLNLFASKTQTKDGTFSSAAAHTFVRDNPSLEVYPNLRAQMLDARDAQILASSRSQSRVNRTKNIKNQAIATKVMGAEPSIAISEIFKAKNPIKAADALLRSAGKDESGDSLKGVQSAMYDHIISKMIKTSTEGREVLSPDSARSFVNNKTNREVVKKIYGESALRLLESVVKGMNYRYRGAPIASPDKMGEKGYGMIKEFVGTLGTVLGARLGGGVSGHTLLAAGWGKRNFLRFFNWAMKAPQDEVLVILQRALEDPDFARSLLVPHRRMTTEQDMKLYRFQVVKSLIDLSGETIETAY